MLSSAFNVTYIIAVVTGMVAWIWMMADLATWAVGF